MSVHSLSVSVLLEYRRYYDPSESYQSAEKLYQKAKENGLQTQMQMDLVDMGKYGSKNKLGLSMDINGY